MDYREFRISKLREYLIDIIDTLTHDTKYQINADMLSNNVNDYSLDKMPVGDEVENWIVGVSRKREVFSLRSRKEYSQDTINNLENIGFFEELKEIINSNDKKGIRPNIDNIEEIKCLYSGTLARTDGTTAEFETQIQIIYRNNEEREVISL